MSNDDLPSREAARIQHRDRKRVRAMQGMVVNSTHAVAVLHDFEHHADHREMPVWPEKS